MNATDDRDTILRAHLLELLDGGSAHLDFERAIGGLDPTAWGARPEGLPHSPWQLLEHLRICQRDILDFSLTVNRPKLDWPAEDWPGDELDWPADYWPDDEQPPNDLAWDRSINSFRDDAQAFRALVADPTTDLLAPIPRGTGQTVAREAMLLADHNAYHLGQLVVVRRLLGAWVESS